MEISDKKKKNCSKVGGCLNRLPDKRQIYFTITGGASFRKS
jgi:hypothetical protein